MKKILYSVLILLGMGLSSCNDWLDVAPETEKDKEDIFSKEEGYKQVLTGAYIRLKKSNLYGKEMVCGTVEKLAQHWNTSSKDPFVNYDYRNMSVESAVANLYNNLYKAAADVNGLLETIDANEGVFKENHYELVKAEALAVRAFVHFDVLRLFGPMPNNIPSDPILPYVTEVKNTPNTKISYKEFVSSLLKDLDEAELLFKDNDPICKNSLKKLNQLPAGSDRFWGYRQMRMNYYAVCAMKARLYLWNGDKAEALKYAKIVMDAKDPDGNAMYRLGNSDDCARKDLTFSTEHIFNLNIHDMATTLGTGKTFEKDQKELTSRLYKNQNPTDIRFKHMWVSEKESYWVNHFYHTKYVQDDKMPEMSKNALPMIRLYEMYLIAMECSPLSVAEDLYKSMSVARDIEPVKIESEEDLRELLILEYNKEFYGEGQAFYAYKRLGAKEIIFTAEPGSAETYVIPLPLQENI